MTFDFEQRRINLRHEMGASGVDAVVLSVGPDLPYFTGYEAMPSERLTALVVTPADAMLFVPELEAARVQVENVEVRSWSETSDPVSLVSELLSPGTRVAVGDHMWSVFLTRLLGEVDGCSWIPASEITSRLRIRKDEAEIDLLRKAAQAVDRVMARIPDEVRFSGRSEVEVARDLAALTVEEGHDESAFTIVAAGVNGASPHHHPGSNMIVDGDLVVCDFGGRLGGYFSDSTRTFAVGEPSVEQRELHDLVHRANHAGRSAVAPGVSCEQIDVASRTVIADGGYGESFIHRTGHGIGLEVHEHPYLVDGNTEPLGPGMAFSVEPGVYLPRRFGIRIEDIVVCTESGAESLNRAERGLVSVG